MNLDKIHSFFPDFKMSDFNMFGQISSLKWEPVVDIDIWEEHKNLFLEMTGADNYKILLECIDVVFLRFQGNGQVSGFYIRDMSVRGYENCSKQECVITNAVGLTSFHSKKREYILQEIWARLLLYNFCKVITTHVTIEKYTKKHTYQINYTFAIQICRYYISKRAEKSPPDDEALIKKEILPVRPGRHDPRKVDYKKVVSFLYRVA